MPQWYEREDRKNKSTLGVNWTNLAIIYPLVSILRETLGFGFRCIPFLPQVAKYLENEEVCLRHRAQTDADSPQSWDTWIGTHRSVAFECM